MMVYRLTSEMVHDRRLRRPKPFQRKPLASFVVSLHDADRDVSRRHFYRDELDPLWSWCVDNIGGLWNGWGLQENRFMFADDAAAFGFKMRFDGAPLEKR